ncbi:hypothetical protein AOQ84DRAFT_166790 [Glonium stellatum]|uniref:Uncharacterized protein n=1 Tax=Glonium stellatum TaxID=574774 RepID=A0A8E2F8T4_9PEZI|nr:hypothetical protein AOQ84DRAFT_166790 [Glonium stellatum]
MYLHALPFTSISIRPLLRTRTIPTRQHNVRVLPCAFLCFRRFPALLLSYAAVHALIDSLRLPSLVRCPKSFHSFQSFFLSPSQSLLVSPRKHFRSLPFPLTPAPKLSTQSCVTLGIPQLHTRFRRSLHSVTR